MGGFVETQTPVGFYAKSDMPVNPSDSEHFWLGFIVFQKISVTHKKEHILNRAQVNDE